MTIKDVLTVTGGRTKVVILSVDEKEKYMALWYGNVDNIDYEYMEQYMKNIISNKLLLFDSYRM